MASAEDILSTKMDDNIVRGMEELVEMFLAFSLRNNDKICNSVVSKLNNNGQRLVDFCSKLTYLESIKTDKRHEKVKLITACGFKMDIYVLKDNFRVQFHVPCALDVFESKISCTLSESIITKSSMNSNLGNQQ